MTGTNEFDFTRTLGLVPSAFPTVDDVRKVKLRFEDLDRYCSQEVAYFTRFGIDGNAVRKSWMLRTGRNAAFRTNGVEAFIVVEESLEARTDDVYGPFKIQRVQAGQTFFVPAYLLRSITPNSDSLQYHHVMLHQPQLASTGSVRDAKTFKELQLEVSA